MHIKAVLFSAVLVACMCGHAIDCIADLLVSSMVHEVRNEVAPKVEEDAGCILACCIQHCRQDAAGEGMDCMEGWTHARAKGCCTLHVKQ